MTEDLFTDLQPVKSPRLLWMEKHGIATYPKVRSGGIDYYAEKPTATGLIRTKASTEHDALVEMALKLNIPLWNQSVDWRARNRQEDRDDAIEAKAEDRRERMEEERRTDSTSAPTMPE